MGRQNVGGGEPASILSGGGRSGAQAPWLQRGFLDIVAASGDAEGTGFGHHGYDFRELIAAEQQTHAVVGRVPIGQVPAPTSSW